MESVLLNLRPGDQYFVIDGGSTDGSVDIIRQHEAKLTGWVSELDRGYADALAKGFASASGDILCWINAGDVLLRGALDAARDAIVSTGADMIFGDDFYIDEDSRVILFSRGYIRDLRRAMLFGGWTPLQDACFWRRSLYERVGGLSVDLQYAADYDLFLRMALAGRAEYVPLAFSAFRRHPGQKSIAGAAGYKRERSAVQRANLAKARSSVASEWPRLAWQAIASRWRARVLHRWIWRRADLAGKPIRELKCKPYWPEHRCV
jgi:glycosyltransferase involved in cell wall biosynthesis